VEQAPAMASAGVQAAEPGENGTALLAGTHRDASGRSSTGRSSTEASSSQAGLLKGGRAAAAPRQAASMSAAPRLQPRPSLPAMRKEVVLATKAELAERRPSREEPLSTFDLEKLKAWGKGWTPDRGRGAAPLWLISSGVAQSSRSAVSSALPVFNMQPNKLMRGWRPDCSTCTCLASEVLRRAALGCLLLRIPCPCST